MGTCNRHETGNLDDTMTAHNSTLDSLLAEVESAVDSDPDLTRKRRRGLTETAEFRYFGSRWSILVRVRNLRARGRGSHGYYDAQGDGETPEQAVASFRERLPFFRQATSS